MVRTHIVLPQGIRKTENIWLYVYHREVLVSEKVIKVFWDTESMSAATRQIDFEDGANFTLKKGPARRFRCLRVIPRICPKFYNGSVVPNYYDNQGTLEVDRSNRTRLPGREGALRGLADTLQTQSQVAIRPANGYLHGKYESRPLSKGRSRRQARLFIRLCKILALRVAVPQ
jgi:hypothetical protein